MVKAAGIDSGTKSMDIYAFDDKEWQTLADEAVPRDLVTSRPEVIIEKIKEIEDRWGELDAIVVSSGYGIPLKRAQDASDEEIALATFVSRDDLEKGHRILGLRRVMELFKRSNLNAYFVPGSVQLPTIPRYRKLNRIDMGTSDKLFSVALAIKDQAERLGISYSQTSFILVEIGYAYTSALAVERGKVVDAMAGTAAFPSFLGSGFIDAELMYAIANTGGVPREYLFKGGAADLAGTYDIDKFVRDRGEAYELFVESIIKDVAALLPSLVPKEIILSGRFSRIQPFFDDVKGRLEGFFARLGRSVNVVKLRTNARIAKEAAEGAAIVANGLAGGVYREVVEVMELRRSSGSIFDYVYLPVKDRLDVYRRIM